MNKITLIGRLADVKGRVSKNGTHSTVFQVVVSESYKDSSGEYQKVVSNFFPVAFGKRAEGINKAIRQGKPPFKKGHLVMIEATVRSNSYVDNGETKYGYDFIVDKIELLVRTLDEMIEARNKYHNSSTADYVAEQDYEIISEPTGQEIYESVFSEDLPKARKQHKVAKAQVQVQEAVDDDIPFA